MSCHLTFAIDYIVGGFASIYRCKCKYRYIKLIQRMNLSMIQVQNAAFCTSLSRSSSAVLPYREVQARRSVKNFAVQIKMKNMSKSIIHEGDYHIVTIQHAHLITVCLQLCFFPNKHTNPKLLDSRKEIFSIHA